MDEYRNDYTENEYTENREDDQLQLEREKEKAPEPPDAEDAPRAAEPSAG